MAVTIVLLIAGCGTESEERDWAAEEQARLLADGVEIELVECMLRVGRNELKRGPLSDAAADELLRNCRAAEQVIRATAADDGAEEQSVTADVAWSLGDDPGLDGLWAECETGHGVACDRLFEQSPVGSEYEDFGVSCGNRPELLNCAELDRVDEQTG